MQNDRISNLSAVLTNHLGNVFGEDLIHVALQIVYADDRATVTFGVSIDSELLTQIRSQILELQRSFALLSKEGKTFIPSSHAVQIIESAMKGHREPHPMDTAQNSLRDLVDWLDEMLRYPEFKKQAGRKRNWRAASVAKTCKRVWALGQFNLRNGVTGISHGKLTNDQLETLLPNTEKYDAPGPFGRFLEDVNLALDILDKNREPFSAASALRSLAQASKQESEK